MEENKKIENIGLFTKIKDKLGMTSKNIPFTAEYAWLETTYGRGSYTSIEDRISHKQKRIRERIEEHFRCCSASETNILAPSYYCLVSIEPDIKEYTDEVFEPFITNGFKIVKINEIEDDNVYVVSWKNIYSNKTNHKRGSAVNE